MLMTADPAATLRQLLAEREPVYAQADITVQSREVPHDAIVTEIMRALADFHAKACRRALPHNHVFGIVAEHAVFNAQPQAVGGKSVLGFDHVPANDVWHFHLPPLNRNAHGGKRAQKCRRCQNEKHQQHSSKPADAICEGHGLP